MYAPDRWWFWGALTTFTAFFLGFAAAQDVGLFLGALPFGVGAVVYGSLETARLIRVDRDEAIRTATNLADRVQRMRSIT